MVIVKTLSDKEIKVVRLSGKKGISFVIPSSDVKEFIKQDTELIDDLQEQLLIDFATPLSIKSANRIIKARIKANQEKRIKLAGPKLVEQTQTKEVKNENTTYD